MSDLLKLVPIYTFMLIPVWIPLAAALFGAVTDLVRAPAKAVAHAAGAPAARASGRNLSPSGPRVPAAGTAR